MAWAFVGFIGLASAAWSAWSIAADPLASAAPATPVSAADARQAAILRDDIERHPDPMLMTRFQLINASHFSNTLPVIPVMWEPRLAEVGELAEQKFTLQGMFGHIGHKTAILLNPSLQSDQATLTRALCHEMTHAYLYSIGDDSTNHGDAFQMVLKRLADERAFEGIAASEDERTTLRAWLDEESGRLDAERVEMETLGAEIARVRRELENDGTDAAKVEDYNRRAADTNARAERDNADLAAFNAQVERYNLMMAYPDGLDAPALKPKPRH